MKRLFRHACAMLAVFLVMSLFTVVNASAANGTTIDTTNAKYGFVTINYTSNAKLKVGIQYGSEKVSYKNCPSGKDAIFSLEQGDGTYTIPGVTGNLVINATMTPKSYNVTVEGTGAGDVTAADKATYNTDYTFTVTVSEGYDAANMVVKVNDAEVTAVDGKYTVEKVSSDLTITVSGVNALRRSGRLMEIFATPSHNS